MKKRKVVDNLMNLILKKKFAEFGSILREIRLFKGRGQKLPTLEKRELKLKFDLLLYFVFEPGINEIKG